MDTPLLTLTVSDELHRAWPGFYGAAVFATVTNTPYNADLWRQIDEYTALYRAKYTTESIKDMPAIQATRQAYKQCGKDPSRYRPSSEALCRRLLRGIPLYQIDTLVDLINLASIYSGHSIGGFDRDKIQGDTLTLGIGRAGEPYEGIGRGPLNIEGMPVYRDALGGIGTPTSDHERTKLTLGTTRLLAIMNGYSGREGLAENMDYLVGLLQDYAAATDLHIVYFN
ncbi:MAG: phenylalanine--tRNA ligase beta subunit-related protein [Bacteroidales bacterium]|nr:phenylalanine--tRNA ligase beta subunit-related protein [Bacteroidales bacterium]